VYGMMTKRRSEVSRLSELQQTNEHVQIKRHAELGTKSTMIIR
jgi:hypothetical protein